MVTSIVILDRGYEDASSSQEREMRREIKIRKLRAEMEEEEQSRKDELTKTAKDRGAGGVTDEAEEEDGGRSNSTEDSGEHREESVEEKQGESGGFPTTDR